MAFDAVVEVRPQLQLAGYDGLRVEIPSPEVTEEDITAQIDRLRNNFAELTTIGRPAQDGDFLTIDLKGTRDGEPVAGLTTDDFSYELGSGTVLPELDDRAPGGPGRATSSSSRRAPRRTGHFRVLVKEVKEKVLPEVTDEWACEASEFDTVEELRADLVERIGGGQAGAGQHGPAQPGASRRWSSW